MSTSILVFDSNGGSVKCGAMGLAENLKKIREDNDLSQARLAKLAGVSQQSISRLEAGKDLTSKYLPRIAAALRVPVSAIDPSYLSPIPDADWTAQLKGAILGAAESGATLQQLREVLDDAFHTYLAAHLRSRIDGLSPELRRSGVEVAEKIAETKGKPARKGKADN